MSGLQCPKCDAPEEHPTLKDRVLLRGYKVFDEHGDWSQCLVCSGYYDNLLREQPDKHDKNKGWFVERPINPPKDGRLVSGYVEMEVLTEEELRKKASA